MTVGYILEDDLLFHLPFCDAAVNLTTKLDNWKKGLASAYKEKYPKSYEKFTELQEDLSSIEVGKVWLGDQDEDLPNLLCLTLKQSVSSDNDLDIIKKALDDLHSFCKEKGYRDVIMPIIIHGTLRESLDILREHLPDEEGSPHYWVGISTKRAEEEELPEQTHIAVAYSPSIWTGYDKEIEKLDLNKDLASDDELIFPLASFSNKDRIVHYIDRINAVVDETSPHLPFNNSMLDYIKEDVVVKFIDKKDFFDD